MIFDVVRFNQYALDLLSTQESESDHTGANGAATVVQNISHQQSIGDYLDQGNYSAEFRNDYLIPMTAAVWSTNDKAALEFPAITLVRFLWNHHLLSTVMARPSWLTIKDGSKQYIDAVMKDFPAEQVHLRTAVTSVNSSQSQKEQKILLVLSNKREELYDHVILATHGDQALQIIQPTATTEEIRILSNFKTSSNTASLHSDLSVSSALFPKVHFLLYGLTNPKLMPTRPVAWSAWNYITTTPTPNSSPTVCLTYNMNILQHISPQTYGNVLVTLNPLHTPSPDLTQGTWIYNHPLYNTAAIRSQQLLPFIQNKRGISYAGAWTKYGFHEDGFSSGLKVAIDHLGAELPFPFVDSTFARGKRPVLGWADWSIRAFVQLVLFLRWVLGLSMGMGHPVEARGKKRY